MTREQKAVDGAVEGVDHIELKRSQPSVEIKKDAKGNVSHTVKVYGDDVMEAMERACEVGDALNTRFKV